MEMDIRGTELAVIREYLCGMGGVAQAPDLVIGEGWQASLAEGEYRFARWIFPRVIVTFDGDAERVAEVAKRLRLLAFRGGG
ncbi:MAG: hypothetical protein K0R39_2804 [Symbiobacteriaceae bacterium]|jgi:hypothetical protein|nr:hypothetical protein [Symbiobacteriaceae bacterium]